MGREAHSIANQHRDIPDSKIEGNPNILANANAKKKVQLIEEAVL